MIASHSLGAKIMKMAWRQLSSLLSRYQPAAAAAAAGQHASDL